ncbi:MAG: DUF4957 domain-containing protein [Bacteroidales bacterium]|nr:DUF4957 domain-containing protein [Bacteroidales bacterium]MCB9012439.1 DUF4957 domain-containing protein [Bacteroidales bacterium]
MMNYNKIYFVFLLLISLAFQNCANTHGSLVHNEQEFTAAIQKAGPGDQIILANGNWENTELLIKAEGTAEKPIIITAEDKGSVIFSGQSDIRISGQYIEISGLVFKNGYTPLTEVISFKEKKGRYASHCRLTECVIDNFNNPERFANETWIALYGKNNRVDHCILYGKRTSGVTMTVRLIDSACQENYHQIDHNYFGYHQSLGSNGGETLRLGTSQYSLTTSGTKVEENYFDRCDGEQEIISNKSCGNSFLNNTFYMCRGTLSFRHGHDNIAEGNFFLGNHKDNTGGIRIINERNQAINNYFFGLTGYRFRGALVIMNGVPNSPINRYNQVVDGVFSNNTFVDCDYIQLCAGSDAERSLPPVGSKIENNVFYCNSPKKIFTVYDDISGIEFNNNYASPEVESENGISLKKTAMKLDQNEYGIWIPESPEIENAGCSLTSPKATRENTGASWYKIEEAELEFNTGKEIAVLPGLNTLYDAVNESAPGDIIVLSAGEYTSTKDIFIDHPVTIKSDGDEKPVLLSEKPEMFTLRNEGALMLEGLKISGKSSPDAAGNAVIATSKYSMNRNYKLMVENCDVEELNVNHSFDFLRVYKNTFADSIVIKNSSFKNITGNIASLDKETDDLGIYNAENVVYEANIFENVGGSVLTLYRGGTDESTFGPIVKFSACTLINCGLSSRNKSFGSIYLYGVQLADVSESSFINSAKIRLHLSKDNPVISLNDLNIWPSADIDSNSKDFSLRNLVHKAL